MADPQPTQLRTSRQLGINRLESVAGVWFPAKGSARARRVLARFALAPHIDLDDEEQPGEADRPLLLSRDKRLAERAPAPASDDMRPQRLRVGTRSLAQGEAEAHRITDLATGGRECARVGLTLSA
jgi:hypothetical protein